MTWLWLRTLAYSRFLFLIETCDACNYDRHTCPCCGDSMTHDRQLCDEAMAA